MNIAIQIDEAVILTGGRFFVPILLRSPHDEIHVAAISALARSRSTKN